MTDLWNSWKKKLFGGSDDDDEEELAKTDREIENSDEYITADESIMQALEEYQKNTAPDDPDLDDWRDYNPPKQDFCLEEEQLASECIKQFRSPQHCYDQMEKYHMCLQQGLDKRMKEYGTTLVKGEKPKLPPIIRPGQRQQQQQQQEQLQKQQS